jgi:TPR repeat protein
MRHGTGDEDPLVAAAKAGDADAAFHLYQLSDQRGDHHDAKHWLHKAADDGSSEALVQLAQPDSNGARSKGQVEMLKRAAQAGHTGAMYALGQHYEREFIIASRQGTDESEPWYRQAADAGNVDAIRTMGRYAACAGHAVEAVGWWRRAEQSRGGEGPDWSWAFGEDVEPTAQRADTSDPEALYRFAKFTRLTTDDRHTMIEVMLRAMNAGNAEATLAFADITRFLMDDTEKDRKNALDMYRHALDRGMTQAMIGLGDLGPKGEAAGWYQKAADAGCADGFARLGNLDVGHNNDEAMAYWTKAAWMQSSDAMLSLYERATSDGKKEEAIEWLRKSAEAGNISAMAKIAHHCNLEGDEQQAKQWLERLAAERPCKPYKPTKGLQLTGNEENVLFDLFLDIL